MRFHFTKHAKRKFLRIRKSGFSVTKRQVQEAVAVPQRVEDRYDGTYVAMSVIDKFHVLRVVHRTEGDIIVIITFYPGRRKAYEI